MAKTRINIVGAIVGQSFDNSWFSSAIDKGVITPVSRIIDALKSAKDVSLYINSQGGSIWAGNEMVNAINAHIAAGHEVEVDVGALSASAAAGILVQLSGAVRVIAARNAQIMFHSASTETWGGPEALRDDAVVLDNYNNSIISALAAKSGKPESEFKAWFAEGRAKWLTAQQALDLKLIDAVSGNIAQAPARPDESESGHLAENKLDIAAFEIPQPEPEPESVAPVSDPAATLKAEFEARIIGLQSAKDKEISALKIQRDELDNALISAQGEISSHLEKIAKFEADNKALSEQVSGLTTQTETLQQDLAASGEQLAQAKTSIKQLGAGALSHQAGVASFEAAVAECNNNVAEARTKYPDLYTAFMASAPQK